MNDIDAAVYSALSSDSTLTTLLGGTAIYPGKAPQGTDFPYVVYQKLAGTKTFTMAAKAWDEPVYAVKAVDDNGTRAGSVAARIETVLTDAALSVSGRTTMYCRPETDVDYPEINQGKTTWHRGHTYRLFVS
jgi:hypothetical protein